jgi:molybdopterin synthase catalytic subunit
VLPPPDSDDWVGLAADTLPVAEALGWATMPRCGAVVVFCGTARDHAPGRTDVKSLAYEAYQEEVAPRLARIAAEARRRWPALGRVALLHRTGELAIGEVSVVVVASAPHRPEAFEAARWAIDTLKTTVPIWKRERWAGGDDWAMDSHDLTSLEEAPLEEAPS